MLHSRYLTHDTVQMFLFYSSKTLLGVKTKVLTLLQKIAADMLQFWKKILGFSSQNFQIKSYFFWLEKNNFWSNCLWNPITKLHRVNKFEYFAKKCKWAHHSKVKFPLAIYEDGSDTILIMRLMVIYRDLQFNGISYKTPLHTWCGGCTNRWGRTWGILLGICFRFFWRLFSEFDNPKCLMI